MILVVIAASATQCAPAHAQCAARAGLPCSPQQRAAGLGALLRMRGGSAFAALEDEVGDGEDVTVCAPHASLRPVPLRPSRSSAVRWSVPHAPRVCVQGHDAGEKTGGAKAVKAADSKESKGKAGMDTPVAVPVPDHNVFNPPAAEKAPGECLLAARLHPVCRHKATACR